MAHSISRNCLAIIFSASFLHSVCVVMKNILLLPMMIIGDLCIAAPIYNDSNYNVATLTVSATNCFLQFIEVMFLVCLACSRK
ncbi:hypothetical protein [Epinotia aporema granulovirus]|uniref:Uncharacterized protein n=1 Tax=Epinotia aporema granulovirus TaxID=166056 RepID=K4ER74_9BBAC|nr:hypothetical protein [Epinotia aporema granulovirus]AER41549.1 hypothetical protein [Epinotia aporema granulovirus]